MTTALLLVAALAPALLAPLLYARGALGALVRAIAPWAALPSLLLAAAPLTFGLLDVPWLVIGSQFELDSVGRIFLIIAASLWTAAGVFARSYVAAAERRRFELFFLLTMSGNLGLPLSADAASFYFFFALMTFAGYGLIVHRRDAEAARAGRIYLILAVGGEAFLLTGLVLAVHAAGSGELAGIPAGVASAASPGLVTLCLLLGFAIKAGAVPLHFWLPLAHPVAPTPASAVLSGSMIKAGLLGWLRFLPLGEIGQPDWGMIVIGLGVVATFFGVVVGVVQTDPKTVLAYSSVSQMGLMNVAVGIALAMPEAASTAVAAVTMYAAHHGLVKGALFLGVGVAGAGGQGHGERWAVMAGLAAVAAAVAGAPLTSGHLAKDGLKKLLPMAPGPWPAWLDVILPLSAAATTLLMARFLVLTWRSAGKDSDHPLTVGLWAPWAALIVLSAVALWVLPSRVPLVSGSSPELPYLSALPLDLLPIAAGIGLYWLLLKLRRAWAVGDGEPRIEPGDILGPIERLIRSVPRPDRALDLAVDRGWVVEMARKWYRVYSEDEGQVGLIRLEGALTRWGAGIALLLALSAAVWLLVARGVG